MRGNEYQKMPCAEAVNPEDGGSYFAEFRVKVNEAIYLGYMVWVAS